MQGGRRRAACARRADVAPGSEGLGAPAVAEEVAVVVLHEHAVHKLLLAVGRRRVARARLEQAGVFPESHAEGRHGVCTNGKRLSKSLETG